MNRCYLCHNIALRDAIYSEMCWRHQLLISWRLFWFIMRSRRFSRGLWRLLRWWQ